jgi:hypothetical protein
VEGSAGHWVVIKQSGIGLNWSDLVGVAWSACLRGRSRLRRAVPPGRYAGRNDAGAGAGSEGEGSEHKSLTAVITGLRMQVLGGDMFLNREKGISAGGETGS